ncbi:ABC transporter permease [Phytoactinopolyspora limicola]|uniref:ABC transporter permease n=1 Tax=Phytoactinopolyspora limicola TaxID=2715536 RepID=UPI00140D7E92
MTATTQRQPDQASGTTPLSSRVGPIEGTKQSLTLAWRSVIQIRHSPTDLADFSVQPIMFVLLFTFMFGGAIMGDWQTYLTFMLPGMIVMNMLFVTMYVGQGLNSDLTKGVFDRFRSLPIARWAPLAGRILAEQVKQIWSIILVLGVGMILGFRLQNGALGLLAAVGLLLFFALAFSWVGVLVGILAKDPERVQIYGMTVLFPVTFMSNVFVPLESLPSWLEPVVDANPVSTMADAVRGLMMDGAESGPILQTLLWGVVFAAVFAPLAVRAFRRRI